MASGVCVCAQTQFHKLFQGPISSGTVVTTWEQGYPQDIYLDQSSPCNSLQAWLPTSLL